MRGAPIVKRSILGRRIEPRVGPLDEGPGRTALGGRWTKLWSRWTNSVDIYLLTRVGPLAILSPLVRRDFGPSSRAAVLDAVTHGSQCRTGLRSASRADCPTEQWRVTMA